MIQSQIFKSSRNLSKSASSLWLPGPSIGHATRGMGATLPVKPARTPGCTRASDDLCVASAAPLRSRSTPCAKLLTRQLPSSVHLLPGCQPGTTALRLSAGPSRRPAHKCLPTDSMAARRSLRLPRVPSWANGPAAPPEPPHPPLPSRAPHLPRRQPPRLSRGDRGHRRHLQGVPGDLPHLHHHLFLGGGDLRLRG